MELPAQRNPELLEELHAVVCGNEKLTATVAELTGHANRPHSRGV
jgi:hypothetical protein